MNPRSETYSGHPGLAERIFHGPGELARLCRQKDWSRTPLGPLASWPSTLRAVASTIVAAPVPMIVLWGPELVQVYNDGYRDMMGKKHPEGLGQPTRECWPEVWAFNAPLYEGVLHRRESFRFEDQPMVIARHGPPEEAFFTLTYSPVTDDEGAVGGVLVTVFETTAAVEHARADEARRESEERLNTALQAADLGTWELDLTRDEAPVRSLRHDRIFGYLEAQPRWGREIATRHVLEEDRPIFDDAFARAADTGRLSFEVRVRWPDDTIHWIEVVGRTYYDHDDRPVRMAGVIADVTERRQADAMRQAVAIGAFRVALDAALHPLGDPVAIQSAAARVLGDHLETCRVLYAPVTDDGEYAVVRADYCRGVASIVGRHRLEDFGPTLIAELRAGRTLVVDDVAENPRLTSAEREATAALSVGAHAAVPLIKRGRLMALLAVHQSEPRAWTDIEVSLIQETAERTWAAVERAETEAALRGSEAKYRTLFESIDEGFTIIELLFDDEGKPDDYRFVETNPAFERQSGLLDAEGRRMRELAPNHEQHWFDVYGHVALTGEPARFAKPAKALDNRWFDVYAFRIGDPAARRVAVLFTDITERRRTDEALRENDRRKDEFLAMLAHELRNPLAAIGNTVKLLERRSPEPGARRYLDILDRQTEVLRGLMADLLDVSRITRGLVAIE